MLRLQRLLAPDERLSHIVVMGMGEPLANLDALLPALDEASREDGLGISARRITISTVGLPKAMRPAGRHERALPPGRVAARAERRAAQQIVPVNEKIPLAEILAEADHYFEHRGRQLTFEYVLLAGLNDSPEHARELASLLGRPHGAAQRDSLQPRGRPALRHADARPPSERSAACSNERGISVHFRHRKGDAIDAACGQLRRRSSLSQMSGAEFGTVKSHGPA